MQKISKNFVIGRFNDFYAEKYSDGRVFYQVAGIWFRAIGQEDKFVANV